ncbi:MAG: TlpA family protein disulfide reductase [Clostridia bacterium]|nr:TlpA family protein disulfide reductase [Clostridia bacterium]
MNQKKSFSVLLIVLLVVLAGAMFAYRYLSDKVTPDTGGSLLDRVTETADTVKTGIESSDAGDTAQSDVFPAMDFTVYDIDRNPVKLSDFFGKPILINFWATWCPPCKSELPDFDRVYADYGEDVVFMMVNMTDGSRDTVESASAFTADNGYSFPVYYDCDLNAAYTYGASSIPMTVLIGADGNIVGGQVGVLTEEQLRIILDTELAKTNNT